MDKLGKIFKSNIKGFYESHRLGDEISLSCRNKINERNVEDGITWLYRQVNKDKPAVIFMNSPMSAQVTAYIFTHFCQTMYSNRWGAEIFRNNNSMDYKDLTAWQIIEQFYLKDWEDVIINTARHAVKYDVWEKAQKSTYKFLCNSDIIKDKIQDYRYGMRDHNIKNWTLKLFFSDNSGTYGDAYYCYYEENKKFLNKNLKFRTSMKESYDSVKAQTIIDNSVNNWQNTSQNIFNGIRQDFARSSFLPFSFFGLGFDIDYEEITFYDMLEKKNIVESNDFYEVVKKLFLSGLFEMIMFDDLCIVAEIPKKIIQNSQYKLHCSNGPAVLWDDGYGLYYWNEINVPRHWIMNKDSISRNDILSEINIEKRRCLMEIIGNEKFIELLDVVCIDTSIDNYGKPMKLFRTKNMDSSINEYLFYLFVVDPSTNREYYISVPPSYDAQWAKKATFQDAKIQFRQGDVGLLNLDSYFDNPIIET